MARSAAPECRSQLAKPRKHWPASEEKEKLGLRRRLPRPRIYSQMKCTGRGAAAHLAPGFVTGGSGKVWHPRLDAHLSKEGSCGPPFTPVFSRFCTFFAIS